MTTDSSTVETTTAGNANEVEQLPATEISIDSNNQQNSDATPESSTDTTKEGAKPKSTLELVKEALKPADPASKDASTESPADADPEKGKAETENSQAKQDSDAEDEKLPFHNHPRWKAVIGENKAMKEQLKDVEIIKTEAAEWKQKAEGLDVIQNFVKQSGLQADEVDTGFQVMAAIKSATEFGGSPQTALDILVPIVQQLQAMSGNVLPDDLQKKVDDGYVDEETAREIARLRAETARTSQQAKVAQSRVEDISQQTQQEAQARFVAEINSAVTAWENDWKTKDADYKLKEPLVKAEIITLIQRLGEPPTANDAILLANHARDEVNKRLLASNLLPKKQEMRTVTGGVSANKTPQVKINSTTDAVRAALRGEYVMQSPSNVS